MVLVWLGLAAEHAMHAALDTEADREQDEGQRQRNRDDLPLPVTADHAKAGGKEGAGGAGQAADTKPLAHGR